MGYVSFTMHVRLTVKRHLRGGFFRFFAETDEILSGYALYCRNDPACGGSLTLSS